MLDPIDDMGISMIRKTKEAAAAASDALSSAFSGISAANNELTIKQVQLMQVAAPKNTGSEAVEQMPQPVFNQYNYSPKALSRREIYRQTNSAFNFYNMMSRGGKK